jgi:adenosylcobyric acid synthase
MFRKAFLDKLGMSVSGFSYDVQIEDTLDRLADHIETYLNVDKIFAIAR